MKDWNTRNRMSGYSNARNRGIPKFVADHGRGLGISRLGKLIARNANRSVKKGARQEAKGLIRRELRHEAWAALIKRGASKRGGTESVYVCGCGHEGCFLHVGR